MATAFVAEHRGQFSVRAMCRCLRIQPSGFYAWLKAPLSAPAQEDRRQTELLRKAWAESGKVYGYRRRLSAMGSVGSSMVVEGDPRSDGGLCLRSCFPGVQIDAFILQRSPQTLDEDIVDAAPFAIHRDPGANLCSIPLASQIMSKRIGRE